MMADVVLVVHFLIVAFIVGGLVLVWVGAALRLALGAKPLVSLPAPRRHRFRRRRGGARGDVPADGLGRLLRGGVRAESFVGRWVRYFLYYEAPQWVFTAAYVAWTVATLVTLGRVRPRPLRREAR